jgi:hypothetical protein
MADILVSYEDTFAIREQTRAMIAQLQRYVDTLSAAMTAQGIPVRANYSQRNPLWGPDKMGTTYIPISQEGCLITSVAAGLTYAGKTFDPGSFNKWLTANGGYVAGTNKFVFDSVNKLGVMSFVKRVDTFSVPADVKALDEWVNSGHVAIVMVDFSPDPAIQTHWVEYRGGGMCMDPWYGDVVPIVPRYKGANAAQAILSSVYYKLPARLG